MNNIPAAIAIDVPNISLPLMRGKLISAEYTPTGETHKPIIIPRSNNRVNSFNKGCTYVHMYSNPSIYEASINFVSIYVVKFFFFPTSFSVVKRFTLFFFGTNCDVNRGITVSCTV